MSSNIWNNQKLFDVLLQGGLVVMPTDTIYGILGSALSREAVGRIYEARHRNPGKPNIILIGDIKELDKFSIALSEKQASKLKEYWPDSPKEGFAPTSIVFDCAEDSLEYLHRGTKTLAFRLPHTKDFRDFLNIVGPLSAPSANPEGLPPAGRISEAEKYFGNSVDLYVDGGELFGQASRVIKLGEDGSVVVIRE